MDPLTSGVAKLPLVSLVVINWNYADYVGEAIESLKAQDYPDLKIVVVDNGSTDASRDVIAEGVAGDPRCSVVHLERNLGQLGAFFEVLPSLDGDFVTTVDADDVLCPNFVSTHVQVHLGLARNAALTSSNLVEIDSRGRLLTGHFELMNHASLRSGMGLRRIDAVPRVPTVSDGRYHELARSVALHGSGGGWIWGTGSSTMYRRSILELVHPSNRRRTWMRAVDNFLNPLCHVFGGSALIDEPLSAYRVHGSNYYSQREVLPGVHSGSAEAMRRTRENNIETLEVFLEKAVAYSAILQDRFWPAFDQLSSDLRGPDGLLLPEPGLLTTLSNNYETLRDIFGEADADHALRSRLTSSDFYVVIRRGHGGTLPSWSILMHPESPVRLQFDHAGRVLRRYRETPVKAAPRAFALDVKNTLGRLGRSTPQGREGPSPTAAPLAPAAPATPTVGYGERLNYGPAALISADPPVFLSGIAFEEHIGIARAFGRRFGDVPAAFVLYPTWTIGSPRGAAAVIEAARSHQVRYPDHQLVFICNTAEERDRLVAGGLRALLLNKNFLVSERIFRPLPDVEVEFDAIYNARFDPLKRHELASQVENLAYLSYDDPANTTESRKEQRELFLRLMAEHPNHVLLNPTDEALPVRLPASEVNAALNRAAVGLCLSRMEGANYASLEYMLAGLPVVSTPSIGGREMYFDPEFCIVCDPDPVAVREAVESLRSRHIPRDYVRERTLARIEPERRRLLVLLDDLRESLGGQRQFEDSEWPFPNASELLLWKHHWAHLAEFDAQSRRTSGPGRGIEATITEYLAEVPDVQLELDEMRPIVEAIQSTPGCSLLVFGCGNDSAFWERVNSEGSTVFLEDDPGWAEQIRGRLAHAHVRLVEYNTELGHWESLLQQPDLLVLDLPEEIADQRFDVILVDAPAGHDRHFELTGTVTPGRMQSIYMASRLVAPGGYVFVHDCDRLVEQRYAAEFLGTRRLFVRAEGRALLQGYQF